MSDLLMVEQATPTTPAAGQALVYFKSDHFAYQMGADGVERVVGVTKRITTLSTAAATPTLTPVASASDEVDITITSSTTTVTFANPTGTPTNGDRLILRVQCTNAQTYAYGTAYAGCTDLALPTAASGANKYDVLAFTWNSTSSKWMLVGKLFGF